MSDAPLPEALISEVGGKGRWTQFAFTLEIVRSYFGTDRGQAYQPIIRHVTNAGQLEGEEQPAWQDKGSGNWAFDLHAAREAATDEEYPDKATRPIVVFLRSAGASGDDSGKFLYALLMPGDPGYDLISDALPEAVPGRLRRRTLTAEELKEIWQDSPLWKYWP